MCSVRSSSAGGAGSVAGRSGSPGELEQLLADLADVPHDELPAGVERGRKLFLRAAKRFDMAGELADPVPRLQLGASEDLASLGSQPRS